MTMLSIRIGTQLFSAVLEVDRAPKTCAAFLARLPFEGRVIQARWSGEAGWIPLGEYDLGVPIENSVSDPGPGQILWHPAGASEAELLVPYGITRFSSKVGQLEGNHFVTIVDPDGRLGEVGRALMWEGAQDISFALSPAHDKPFPTT
ncbi:MAG: DUF3830 family protein [Gemmatimonadales bacterium]